MLALVGGATAQEQDAPGIRQLVESFMNADQSGPLVVANDPNPTNPFGDSVQLPSDKIDLVSIDQYTGFRINPGPNPGFDHEGINLATAGYADNGTVATEIIPLHLTQNWIPPVREGLSREEFLSNLLRSWDSIEEDESMDAAEAALEATSAFRFGDVIIVPPPTGIADSLNSPLAVRGATVSGMLPLDGCSGDILELFTGDAINGAPLWEPRDFAPNDSFGGISQAHVTRCVNDAWQPPEFLVNQGPNFQAMPSGTYSILSPEGFFTFIPAEEVSGSQGFRIGTFVTPESGGYQPHNVGFTTAPPYPELTTPGSDPFFIEHPFPGHTLHPVVLDMGDADDGSPGWMGNYGLAFDSEDDSAGIDTFNTHKIQFDTYQLTRGLFKMESGQSTYAGELSGSGDGYPKKYSFTEGTYEYDADSLVVYPMMVAPGTDHSFTEALATTLIERELDAQEAETTATDAPDATDTTGGNTTQDTATTSEDGTAEPVSISDDSGGVNPIVVFLMILLLLAIAGFIWWWFFQIRQR